MWWFIVGFLFSDECPRFEGRTCNHHGTCAPLGYCICDAYFSGDACHQTMVPGWLRTSNLNCRGRGNVTLSVVRPLPACNKTEPTVFRGRQGGWSEPACVQAVLDAQNRIYVLQRATEEDYLGTPMCLCEPPFTGVDCGEIGTNNANDAGTICSNHGNETVGYMNNGTDGIGLQCTHPIFLPDIIIGKNGQPNMTEDQVLAIGDDLRTFQNGLCARRFVSSKGEVVLIPDVPYACFCDERHYGVVCEKDACPSNALDEFCGLNGHERVGFGFALNTTESTSVYGKKCTPLCNVGQDGCCFSNPDLCKVKETKCPSDRPWRCSTTQACVAKPIHSKCDLKYEYGYLDDPHTAVRRPLVGTFTTTSPVVWFEIRPLTEGTLKVTHGDFEEEWDGTTLFWKRVLQLTTETIERDAFMDFGDVRVYINAEGFVEMNPAPFIQGDEFDAIMRLRSARNEYAVIDVVGSRVVFTQEGDFVLANLTSGLYLRPGGSVVSSETCLVDLRACAWTLDFVALDGSSRLCEFNGALESTSVSCPLVNMPLQRVSTVVYGTSRVTDVDFDKGWTLQTFMGVDKSREFVVEGSANYTGFYLTVDDLRLPCACEPPVERNQNQSLWNRQWINEFNRPDIASPGARAVALVSAFGDARVERGILDGTGNISNGYESFRITRAKRLSQAEFKLGIPNPNDYVYPARCPRGEGAQLRAVERRNVVSNTTCVASGSQIECDNGCVCTTTQCTCPEPESEMPMLSDIQSRLAQKCFVTRGARGATFDVTETGNRTCVKASTFTSPIHITLDGCDENVWVEGRFATQPFSMLQIDKTCVNNATTTVIQVITDDSERVLDEWCVYSAFKSTFEWAPVGISAWRTNGYQLSASHPSNVSNVVWNDATWWGGNWLRVDFDRPVHLIGVYVVFRTVGVATPNGAYNISVDFQAGNAQSSNRQRDWTFLDSVFSNVVNGTEAKFFQIEGTYESFRLISRFPMEIRRLLPLTDQDCAAGLIRVGETLPEDVIQEYFTRQYDPNVTECLYNNECRLNGLSVARDGVCSDFKYESSFYTPSIEVFEEIDVSPQEVVFGTFPNTTLDNNATFVCESNGCCAWGFDVMNKTLSCNTTDLVYMGNYTLGITETPETGRYVRRRREQRWGPGLVEGVNTCITGTDGDDCGPSNRLLPRAAGMGCPDTELEIALRDLNSSAHEFAATASLTDILAGGSTLEFVVTYARNVTTLGRGKCEDCDGQFRCVDGTCADSENQCPVAYYRCPGDGCNRDDPNRREYKCACRVGYSGGDCTAHIATALDMRTGAGDPHAWSTCGGPVDRKFPKIRLKLPASASGQRKVYTTAEILAANRVTPRQGDRDVGWINFQATEKPYEKAISRQIIIGGVKMITNCDFYKRLPDNSLVEFNKLVKKRSDEAPHIVLEWQEFDVGNGSKVIFPGVAPLWEATYDDAPIRCGSSCVSDMRECYRLNLVNPPCGGHGTCLADSTCKCDKGYTTFVLTEKVSKAVSVPYATVNGESDPLAWDTPDSIDFDTATCMASNCTEVDCSPQYGCFTGTPELRFADRLTTCASNTGHGGRCGVDAQACFRGEVTDPLPCFGNGILRKHDYRDEWYCVCGKSKGSIDPRESNELEPNGFGGRACNEYWWGGGDNTIWIQRINPITKLPYVGSDGLTLPFVWRSKSGAPVGARPEDLPLWQQCCPGIKRLEKCAYVPCGRGSGVRKIFSCELAENCLDAQSVPAVYVCNGHGRARADGTCACDSSESEGYTYDLSVFSYKGCYRKAQCSIARNSRMCNAKATCGDFSFWSELPKLEYMEQQWQTLLLLAGLPPNNATFVDVVFKDRRADRLLFVLSRIAQRVLDAIAQAASTICVFPNDDPLFPVAMLPYDPTKVCQYGDGFISPWYANATFVSNSTDVKSVLTDGLFGGGDDYLKLSTIFVTYPEIVTLQSVRIHARRVSSLGSVGIVRVRTITSDFVCDDLEVSSSTFAWSELQCVSSYSPFEFGIVFPNEFAINCKPDETTLRCTDWKDRRCAETGNIVNKPGNFDEVLLGCENARCCIRRRPPFVNAQTIVLSTSDDIDIDEAALFVYGRKVVPTPDALNREIEYRVENTTCRDGKFMSFAFGSSLAYYKQREWRERAQIRWPDPEVNHDWASARAGCENTGGVLATTRGGTLFNNDYAGDMGRVCFGLEKDESPPSDRAAQLVGCLVGARERSEKKNPVMTEFVDADALRWGCWTPSQRDVEGAIFDYASTPIGDKDGAQWKTEWTNVTSFVSTRFALSALRLEAVRQRALRLGSDGYMQMQDTRYWQRLGLQSITGRSPWQEVYAARVIKGQTPAINDPGFRPQAESVWTNPQTCVITVYSNPMCGRFFGNILGPLQNQNDGEVKAVYVVTPTDDYRVLDFENLLEVSDFTSVSHPIRRTYFECVNGRNQCQGQGEAIKNNVKSISIQGPCMVELKGVELNGDREVPYTYRLTEPGKFKTYAHYTSHLTYVGSSTCDPKGEWVDGCYSQFNRDAPLDFTILCTVPIFACTWTGELPDLVPVQTGQAPNGFPQNTLRGLRIFPKFNTRRLKINHRANPTASTREENDYVLGVDKHPFMCSNIKITEDKRWIAGARTASFNVVDRSIRDERGNLVPVRVRRNTNPITYVQYQPSVFAGEGSTTQTQLNTYIPTESEPQEYAFTWPEMRDVVIKGAGSTLILPYATCASLGRPIKRCRDCLLPQGSNWEWDQRFYNPERGDFVTSVSAVNGGQVVRPRLHASWMSTTHPLRSYEPLEDLEFDVPQAFARLISGALIRDYRRDLDQVNDTTPGLYHDWCLKVMPTSVGTFVFTPTVCEARVHKAMCIRDIRKHTVQSGCQADVCGCNSRSSAIAPGSTAFTLNPLAKRENFEKEHEIADAYASGDLSAYLDTVPLPVNEIAGYVRSLPQAFIGAMQGFWPRFLNKLSTRSSRLSRGQVADVNQWTDFDLNSWFPYDCGLVQSRKTGLIRPMCAISSEQCTMDTTWPRVPMNAADLPLSLSPVVSADPRSVLVCGRQIKPSELIDSTDDEPPVPQNNHYVVLESTAEHVVIRTLVQNGTFRNSRRDVGVLSNSTQIRGSTQCSSELCHVNVWVTSRNFRYEDPLYQWNLGSALGDFVYDLTTNASYWRTVAWTFSAPIGTTIRITNLLVSDDASVQACLNLNIEGVWVESPPAMESPSPQHKCVFTEEEALKLNVIDVGVCWCSPASPYGGPGCEWPATIGRHGKRVCGSPLGIFADQSKAVAPNGELVTVNSYGVFTYGAGDFGCKTKADVGSRIKSRLIGGSISDFRYVVKSMDSPNLQTFIQPTSADLERLGFVHLNAEDVQAVCSALSATLPSFSTGDEIRKYVAIGKTPVLLDLVFNGDWRWNDRGELLKSCGGNATCGGVTYDPCESNDGPACRALNYNNLVFNSSSSFLVDGKNNPDWTTSIQLNLTRTVDSGITVTVLTNTTVTVTSYCPTCGFGLGCAALSAQTYRCGGTLIDVRDYITGIQIQNAGGFWASEIGAFWSLDSRRPPLF